jgi:hypothetical protein
MRPRPRAPHSPLSARHHPDGVLAGKLFASLHVIEAETIVTSSYCDGDKLPSVGCPLGSKKLTWERMFSEVRFVPQPDVSRCSKQRALFDHLVGSHQERFGNF